MTKPQQASRRLLWPLSLVSAQMLAQMAGRPMASALLVAALTIACGGGMRDYTQLSLDVALPESGDEAANEAVLVEAQTVIEKRLKGLNLEEAELSVASPDQITVRLPQKIGAEAVAERLVKPGLLTLRNQKADTDEALSEGIETLQRLLVEQNNLKQTGNQAEAEALQPQIDESRVKIIELFEPPVTDGNLLLDAKAVEISGYNTWEVKIWFDSQGTDKLAEQTKAIAGTGRVIGIFLDDVLLSTPVIDVSFVESGVTGGEAAIDGSFTAEAAKDLEAQLKSGPLPTELELVSIKSSDDPDEAEAAPEALDSEAVDSENSESEQPE
ncbi:MAG: hypothetical protein AAGN15_14415 [Cyanobacteria bacterium J06581_3]